MNEKILRFELEKCIGLFDAGIEMLSKLGDGKSSDYAALFCLYNALERLLKIAIAFEKKEKRIGHDIKGMCKEFLGNDYAVSWNTDDINMLDLIHNFAQAKDENGRYANIDKILHENATLNDPIFDLLRQLSLFAIVLNVKPLEESKDSSKNTLGDHIIDVKHTKELTIKRCLYNILDPIIIKLKAIDNAEEFWLFYRFVKNEK